MTTYAAVAAAQIDADSPMDTVLATQFTNNLLAVIEGDATAPAVAYLAMEDFTASSPAFTVAGLPGEVSHSGGSFTKVKEIEIPKAGNYQVVFQLKNSDNSTTVNGRIYVNGSASGTSRAMTSSTYTTYTETISSLSAGDLVQIYSNQASADTVYVRGFLIEADQSGHFGPRVDYV